MDLPLRGSVLSFHVTGGAGVGRIVCRALAGTVGRGLLRSVAAGLWSLLDAGVLGAGTGDASPMATSWGLRLSGRFLGPRNGACISVETTGGVTKTLEHSHE